MSEFKSRIVLSVVKSLQRLDIHVPKQINFPNKGTLYLREDGFKQQLNGANIRFVLNQKKKCAWFLILTSGYLPDSEELWKSIMLLEELKIGLRE